MAISIKTDKEISIMREGGKFLAEVLEKTLEKAIPGVSTYELDQFAENFIKQKGAIPSFKGYHGFPATLCTCINEVIVHGIPKKNIILQEGDLFTVDCGIFYKGLHTDAARTKEIGKVSKEKSKLLKTAKIALGKAIDIAKPGKHVGDISKIIQETIENAGFHVIKDLTGHGIGKNLHEPPQILNHWDGSPGPILKAGMTLAIEPIFSTGTSKMKTLKDKWTIVTTDGSCAVQVENTILITPTSAEILTSQN